MRVSRRAQIYAQSLFSLSPDLEPDLAALSSAIEEESQFFLSPIISAEEKEETLRPVLEKFSPILTHFILILTHEKALSLLPGAALCYRKLLLDFKGEEEAEVFSRAELSPKDLESLKAALQPALKKKPLLKARKEGKSQGGILVRASDLVFNDTVEFHLKRVLEISV